MDQKNDVLAVLVDIRQGAVASDINQEFNEMVQAVLDTGQKGEMTVKLTVKPTKFGMGGCVVEVDVAHDVKAVKPRLSVGSGVFYVSREGRLSREPQDQLLMFNAEESKQK